MENLFWHKYVYIKKEIILLIKKKYRTYLINYIKERFHFSAVIENKLRNFNLSNILKHHIGNNTIFWVFGLEKNMFPSYVLIKFLCLSDIKYLFKVAIDKMDTFIITKEFTQGTGWYVTCSDNSLKADCSWRHDSVCIYKNLEYN